MNNCTVNSSTKLETQSYTPPTMTPAPITLVKPVSYQFQVVEYMKDDKIVKVELQAQATTHDENGNVVNCSGFKAVPRIQLPYIDHK
jgi:hypothetical protein